jgi:ketosteroid isomerase-like protein
VSFDEDYMAAWNKGDVDAYCALFAPDGRYTDAVMKLTYDGIDEIRRMFTSTMMYYQDPQFIHVSGFADDRHYAVEWTSITIVDGTQYETRVVSIGDLDENGKITENRDYWDPQSVPNDGSMAIDMTAEAEAYARTHVTPTV